MSHFPRVDKIMEGNTSIGAQSPQTQELPDRAALQREALLQEAHLALSLIMVAERRRERMPLTPAYLEGLVAATGSK